MPFQNYDPALHPKVLYMIKNSHINLKLNNTTIMVYNIFTKYCISFSYGQNYIECMWHNYQVKNK
jgi:hypothetical protein